MSAGVQVLRGIIVGAGRAGAELQCGAFLQSGVGIAAVCDADTDLARDVSRRWGVGAHYASLEEAMGNHEADFVSICTPPPSHFELAKTAMEGGSHVLIEKPVAIDFREFAELDEVRQRLDRKMVVVHNHKFLRGVRAALAIHRSGALGRPLQVNHHHMFQSEGHRMMAPSHWSHRLPGGRLMEALPHSLYIPYNFVGPMELRTVSTQRSPEQPDYIPVDELEVVCESESGFVSIRLSINMTAPVPGQKEGFVGGSIIGDRGALVYDYGTATLHQGAFTKGTPADVVKFSKRVARRLLSPLGRGARRRLMRSGGVVYGSGSGHDHVIRMFVDHIASGGPPPTSPDEARNTAKLWWEVAQAVSDRVEVA